MFVNINEHPSNRNKQVFFFKDEHHADYFENLLLQEKINYEKQVDVEGDQRIYFGVHKTDFKKVQRLNYLTIGNFRKPFIADPIVRYLMIAVSLLILALAFVGAWKSN